MDFSQLSDEDLDAFINMYQPDGVSAQPDMQMAQAQPDQQQMMEVPQQAATNQPFQTPTNLSTGAQVATDLLLGPQAFLQGGREGVYDAGRGLKQAYLQATQALGLQPEGTVENYTKQTDKARQDYAQNFLTQAMPKTAATGEFIGNVAPYLAIPGVGGENLAAQIGRNALLGGSMGATQYVPEGGSRALNTALGGAVGGALPLVGAGITKGINAYTGGTEDAAAKAIIDAGAQHNVPVFASDASQNSLLKGLTNGLEDIPFIGTKGARADQMTAARDAADNLVNKTKMDMVNTDFGGRDGIGALQDIAQSGDPIRGKAAQSLLNDIQGAGDDWQKIIENSGNLKSFQNKLVADQKYSDVADLANQFGEVPKINALSAVDDGIQKAGDSILPDTGLINTLQTIKMNLEGKSLNYNQMRAARSQVGNLISDYYKGGNAITGSEGVGYLQGVKNGLDKDMNMFAQKNGPELKTAWQDADNYYKNNVIPYKNTQLAKALTNASPDEIYSKFITNSGIEGGKGTSRAQRFYNALDDKGQAAVRYGMVSNAFENAVNRDTGGFSSGAFASSLDKIAAARGVFFKGDAKAELDGFKNLMRNVERSKIATTKPETGIKAIPYIATALGFGAAHALGASTEMLGLGGAGVYALRKLLTSDAGRKLLLASSKLEVGSPAMQKVLNRTTKLVNRAAILGGSNFANTPSNSQPTPAPVAKTIAPNPMQNLSDEQLDKIIQQHAPHQAPQAPQHAHVSPQLLNKISHIESNNNPMAKASGSSASGLFQFTNGTWKEAVNKYGKETGIGLADKNNPKAQRIMAEMMLTDNAQELESKLGRAPKDAEIYLSHFLGIGGAEKMLASNPRQFAARVLPDAASSNRGLFYRNGRPLTVAELYQNLDRKIRAA